MKTAPATNSALRPNRSATEVMTRVIAALPASAAVKIQPIETGLSPMLSR
jgi:hypothetical protein